MSKTLRAMIWSLYYEGYMVHQISDMLDVSEWQVIQVLQPEGY